MLDSEESMMRMACFGKTNDKDGSLTYMLFWYFLLCPHSMTEPQPNYSAYREASFGHAILDIKNRTHAYYAWHRNQDGVAAVADWAWFYNRIYHPLDEIA